MIDIHLKYQIVLFGGYQEIGPKPDTLKYFIEKFSDKELIPTTFQEFGPQGPLNRFSLTTSDEVWLIEFSTNRIDIQKTNKNIGVTPMGTLIQFIEDAKEIVAVINERFPKKHNRLSLVTRSLLKSMESSEIDSVYRKLNNSIDLYKTNPIVDWGNRTVTRIPMEFSKTTETFNVISEVKRTKGNLSIDSKKEHIDRIELHFDLNTFQGNTDYRFDIDLVNSFLDRVYQLEHELTDKYLNLIQK